jgi:hypothetical protein
VKTKTIYRAIITEESEGTGVSTLTYSGEMEKTVITEIKDLKDDDKQDLLHHASRFVELFTAKQEPKPKK